MSMGIGETSDLLSGPEPGPIVSTPRRTITAMVRVPTIAIRAARVCHVRAQTGPAGHRQDRRYPPPWATKAPRTSRTRPSGAGPSAERHPLAGCPPFCQRMVPAMVVDNDDGARQPAARAAARRRSSRSLLVQATVVEYATSDDAPARRLAGHLPATSPSRAWSRSSPRSPAAPPSRSPPSAGRAWSAPARSWAAPRCRSR